MNIYITFNLPNLTDRFLKGGTSKYGSFTAETLPAHEHGEVFYDTSNNGIRAFATKPGSGTGNYKIIPIQSQTSTYGPLFTSGINNSVYKDNAKVQPDNVKVMFIIKH